MRRRQIHINNVTDVLLTEQRIGFNRKGAIFLIFKVKEEK